MFEKQCSLVLCLVLLYVNQILGKCSFGETSTPMCYSLRDIQVEGYSGWRDLSIINLAGEPLQRLQSESFRNSPELRKISLKNITNGIDIGAFRGLNNLESLNLEQNFLNVFPRSVISHLPIKKLSLLQNRLTSLLPGMLELLPLLEYVLVKGELIENIPYGVFNDLGIRKIELVRNRISNIATSAFVNMNNLQMLNLGENQLQSFHALDAMGIARSVQYLYLNDNKLTHINEHMFNGLPNLNTLYLSNNQITYIGMMSFQQHVHLTDLSLANNRLMEIKPGSFGSNQWRLKILYLSNNNLTFLSLSILRSFSNLKEVSLVGNPWQCPCWEILRMWMVEHNIRRSFCESEYKIGNIPVCVTPYPNTQTCVYDRDETEEFAEIYARNLVEYLPVPACLLARFYI